MGKNIILARAAYATYLYPSTKYSRMLKNLWKVVVVYSDDIARCLEGNTLQDPTTATMRRRDETGTPTVNSKNVSH